MVNIKLMSLAEKLFLDRAIMFQSCESAVIEW